MTWLLDTNVISEVRKGSRCDPNVAAWWAAVDERDLFLSALTVGEIRKGIEKARPRDPGKAADLESWLADVTGKFGSRVLGIDTTVAEVWGRLSAMRTIPVIDALLAATASVHRLVLVTRNVSDVQGLGVQVVDPFAVLAPPLHLKSHSPVRGSDS